MENGGGSNAGNSAKQYQLPLDTYAEVNQLERINTLSQTVLGSDPAVRRALTLAAVRMAEVIEEKMKKQGEMLRTAVVPGSLRNVLGDGS